VAVAAAALALIAGGGCAAQRGGAPAQAGDLALPATFTGELPCADCEAIAWHLDLLADRSFQLRLTYRGRPDGEHDDIGAWAPTSDGRALVLQGGREAPVRLAIESPDALRLLDREGEPIVSDLNTTLRRAPDFAPIEPHLLMRGMYSYLADAASFTECLTGRRLPVAMEADNRALEAAYLAARRAPGEALLVSVEGRIAPRPPMEGPGPVPTLVPERFVGIWPGETCGEPFTTARLRNTYWKLTRLADAPVERCEGQREPHLVLRDDGRFAGSDGCNRLAGGYRAEGDTLTFSPVAGTRLACPHGMEQAQRFIDALGRAARHRIAGVHLELRDAAGGLLARFEATPLE